MSLNKIGIILVVLTVIPYSYGRQGLQLSDPDTVSRIEEMLLTQQIQISELTKTVSEQNEELVVQRRQISELTKTVSEQNEELVVQRRQISELTKTVSEQNEELVVQRRQISELTKTVSEQYEELVVQRRQISELTKTVSEQYEKLVVQTVQINELKENDTKQKDKLMYLRQKMGGLERRTGYLSSRVVQFLHEMQRHKFDPKYTTYDENRKTDLTLGDKAVTSQIPSDGDRQTKTEHSMYFSVERLLVGNENASTMVGFYAYITTDEPMGQHKVMVFNVVETNIGRAYNNHTGTFVAPVTGLYAFSCSLYPAHQSRGSFHLYHNDKAVARIFTDSDSANWDVTASSMTAVLFLQQGDDVYLRSREKSAYTNIGNIAGDSIARSSLSGWLISE